MFQIQARGGGGRGVSFCRRDRHRDASERASFSPRKESLVLFPRCTAPVSRARYRAFNVINYINSSLCKCILQPRLHIGMQTRLPARDHYIPRESVTRIYLGERDQTNGRMAGRPCYVFLSVVTGRQRQSGEDARARCRSCEVIPTMIGSGRLSV